MARPSVNSLQPVRNESYRPSSSPPGINGEHFESVEACLQEDTLRARLSRKTASRTKVKAERKPRLALARKLDYEARNKPVPMSLASSSHMRGRRDAVFSHVCRLAARYDGLVTTATVINREWEFTPAELETLDLKPLLNAFVADLDRRGAACARGWLLGFIHGEWETPSQVFRLHMHMVVAGEMIEVVDRLRTGRNYKHRPGDNVRCRVRIDRKSLTNLPYPFTYCFKAYWPWKHVFLTANGERRTRRHRRIPEPYHTQVLQFLDRHGLNEFVVLKHVSVRNGRLRLAGSKR